MRTIKGGAIPFVLLFAMAFTCNPLLRATNTIEKKRVIILTDLGSDADDKQSLTRLLLYANDMDIEGLIATSATISPWNKTGEPQVEDIISRVKAYGQVLNNLRLHSKDYPSEEYLLSIVKKGTKTGRSYGTSRNANGWPIEETIGEGKDTEASDLIIRSIDKDDPRPLWICIWGGGMDLAQALWRIRNDLSEEKVREVVSRLRVYSWGHQDLGGQWMRDNFPELFQINSTAGILDGADPYFCSANWLYTNVRTNHGPLGAMCPYRNPGLTEADSETYLGLIPNGLSSMEHPDWGGWGGRMIRDMKDTNMWVDISVSERINIGGQSTISRWAPEFQNDYQARMDWCVKDFKDANHNPQVVINGDSTFNPISLSAKPGQTITLDAGASTDPDGDPIFFRWFVYEDVSTIEGTKITHELKENPGKEGTEEEYFRRTPEWEKAILSLPEDESGVIHLILACTDYGIPALTRYRRIIIYVE